MNGCEMKHKEFHKVKDHQTFLKVIRFSKLSVLLYIGKFQKQYSNFELIPFGPTLPRKPKTMGYLRVTRSNKRDIKSWYDP